MNEGQAKGLRALLGESGAYREGHFEVGPAQHVLSYVNAERLFQYPALASRAASYLVERLPDVRAGFVFAPSISTQVLAFEVARRLEIQYVSNALPFTDAGYRFPSGSRALVVEDVAVSGRSLRHARAWLAERGADVAAFAVLYDRRPMAAGSSDDLEVVAVLRDPVRVYAPSDCPACQDGLPVSPVEPNYPVT